MRRGPLGIWRSRVECLGPSAYSYEQIDLSFFGLMMIIVRLSHESSRLLIAGVGVTKARLRYVD